VKTHSGHCPPRPPSTRWRSTRLASPRPEGPSTSRPASSVAWRARAIGHTRAQSDLRRPAELRDSRVPAAARGRWQPCHLAQTLHLPRGPRPEVSQNFTPSPWRWGALECQTVKHARP
jgi:hypothetical protein